MSCTLWGFIFVLYYIKHETKLLSLTKKTSRYPEKKDGEAFVEEKGHNSYDIKMVSW